MTYISVTLLAITCGLDSTFNLDDLPISVDDLQTNVEGESLTSVYERFSILITVMDQNNVHPQEISISTKFHYIPVAANIQFEPRVNASKAKKAARNHDPLALVANSHAHSSNSHASSSYSRSPQPYYVTHPSSVIDNDDDYQGEIQGDAQEDKLTTAMMLLTRAITQCYSTPTNNRLRTSSNTRNQAVIQDGRVDIQSKNVGYAGNGNRNAGRQNRNQATNARNGLVQEQMILATKYEAGVHIDEEENDFMLNNAYGDNTLEELNATVIMMLNATLNASQVDMINGLLSKSDHEQRHHEKLETIIHTLEAEKQRKMNIELKKQQALRQRELEKCKERVKEIENKPEQNLDYREAYEELQIEMNVKKEQLLNENVSANITIFNLYILFMFGDGSNM
ncbi:hypothetical protein Tco_0374225 [Tanacetum coccineum]